MALRNARQLYKTCVDEGAIESDSWRVIFQLIQDKLGGWPLLSTTRWNKFFFDLSVTLLKLNQYNTFPFFRVATTLDYNSTTSLRYRIRVSKSYSMIITAKFVYFRLAQDTVWIVLTSLQTKICSGHLRNVSYVT